MPVSPDAWPLGHSPPATRHNSPPVSPDAWPLDPTVAMLNHGSFGACPRAVLQRQADLRRQMEAEPVRFLVRQVQPLLDESRRALAGLVGAQAENLVFVSNATAGINAVLRSLRFRPGEELLLADHGYNACNNAVRYVAQRDGATAVVIEIPIPVESPDEVVRAVLARVTGRTRLAVLDHVTSPTAIVLPIHEIVRQLSRQGVDCLVDGAHGPGMVPLDLDRLGAAYYAGNCHKWLCAPKGAGFLYVRPDRKEGIQPPVISHGYNQPRRGYNRLQDAFDWQGTLDPTPWLCVGTAIAFLEGLLPGGLVGLMRRNHELAVASRRMLSARLPLRPICPEDMLGSMAALLLPDRAPGTDIADPAAAQPLPRLGAQLLEEFSIEVPVYYWLAPPQTLLRISAQAYNNFQQYERLAECLAGLLAPKR
ncbi:MAG: aminotransferase class V-fold PLP-dependent enzyme [Thermoguttaceae bacterium]